MRFGSIFLAFVYNLVLKICGLIYKFVYRPKLSRVEDNGSSLIAKCQVICGENVSGFLEEAKTVKFVVQEMFVGSDDVHTLGSEISEKNLLKESDSFSFHFDLLKGFSPINQDSQDQIFKVENFDQDRVEDHCKIDQESVENHFKIGQERVGDHYFKIDQESVENHFKIDQERVEDHHFKIDQESVENHFKIDQEREEDHLFKIDQESVEDHCKIDQESVENHFKIDQESVEDHCKIDQESVEDHCKIDQESVENHFKIDEEREDGEDFNHLCSEEILEGIEKSNSSSNFSEDEIQDFSYEIELLPSINSSAVADQESDTSDNWMSNFLDQEEREDRSQELDFDHKLSKKVENLDDEYIEFENLSYKSPPLDKESTKVEENFVQTEATTTFQDAESDDEDDEGGDEPDVLSEHQNLVQQMKMELRACRIKSLPTISEECESPKVLEDLKPLDIDHKIEYKDIMAEIQKFYKSFSEKMRKLDILSYQTLHAISFLQLKDSEGKKKADLVPSVLPKIWQRKVQRIYADPMQKSISDMHRDLEFVYVGQLCLSWEILSWLYVKARELLDYDCDGKHSYNRAAEEFQQFQVLMQRFMEDEPFQEHRNRGYVRSRWVLQVPIIKDDCVKIKKERREESDAVPLKTLVEIIRESMLIFRDFLLSDKKSTNVATKVDLHDPRNSELLSNIISNLQKKERRVKDSIRSRNCIVKKLKGQRLDDEMLTCQVELRLVVRVLNMSRLTTDQLVWCSKKLENISFVGRKVHIEPSFLLFPC